MTVTIKIIPKHVPPPAVGDAHETGNACAVIPHAKHEEGTSTTLPSDPVLAPPLLDPLKEILRRAEDLSDATSAQARMRELMAKWNQIKVELAGVVMKRIQHGWHSSEPDIFQVGEEELGLDEDDIIKLMLLGRAVEGGSVAWADIKAGDWATFRRVARQALGWPLPA